MYQFVVVLAAMTALAAASPSWVGHFSIPGNLPAPWRMVPYQGEKPTSYRVASVEGRMAIEARADKSMSLMARPIAVDLGLNPVACWRWYVD